MMREMATFSEGQGFRIKQRTGAGDREVKLPYMETPSGKVDRRVLFFGLWNVHV